MSLHAIADHMASKGRGPDTMLIHMAPEEVQGLQALAMAHGGSLTINPETGLPEAGWLSKLLPAIIGFAVTAATGIPAWQVGLGVGAVETARTGDLGKGIQAGLGAYGGAGLGAGLTTAGAGAIGSEAAGQAYASAAPGVLEGASAGLSADMAANLANAGVTDTVTANAAQQAAAERVAAASPFEKLSAGVKSVGDNPMSFANKDNFKYLAAGAAPILADQAIKSNLPTTVTKPGMIRPYAFDPYGGTYEAGTPYEATPTRAAEGGLMGMADGGYSPGQLDFAQHSEPVLRMAAGGMPGYAGDEGSLVNDEQVFDYFKGLDQSKLNSGALDSQIAADMQKYKVSPEDIARITGTQNQLADYQTRFAAQPVNSDPYAGGFKIHQGQENLPPSPEPTVLAGGLDTLAANQGIPTRPIAQDMVTPFTQQGAPAPITGTPITGGLNALAADQTAKADTAAAAKLGVFQTVYDPKTGREFNSPAQALQYGVTDYVTSLPSNIALPSTAQNAVNAWLARPENKGKTTSDALNSLGAQFGMTGEQFRNAEIQGTINYGDQQATRNALATENQGLTPEQLTAKLQAYKAKPPTTAQEFAEQRALYADYANRYANSSYNYANMGGKAQDFSLKPADYLSTSFTGYADPINFALTNMKQNSTDFKDLSKILTNNPEINDVVNQLYKINPEASFFNAINPKYAGGTEASTMASNFNTSIKNLAGDIERFGSAEAMRRFVDQQQKLLVTTPDAQGNLGNFNQTTMANPEYRALNAIKDSYTPIVDSAAWNKRVTNETGRGASIGAVYRDADTGKGLAIQYNQNGAPQEVRFINQQGQGINVPINDPAKLLNAFYESGMSPSAFTELSKSFGSEYLVPPPKDDEKQYFLPALQNGIKFSDFADGTAAKVLASDSYLKDVQNKALADYQWDIQHGTPENTAAISLQRTVDKAVNDQKAAKAFVGEQSGTAPTGLAALAANQPAAQTSAPAGVAALAASSPNLSKNISDWIAAHPNATDAEVDAEMAKYGVTGQDVATALPQYGGSKGLAWALNQGDMGLAGLNKNILDYVASHGNTATDRIVAENTLAKYGLNEADVKRATGKTLDELFAAKKTDTTTTTKTGTDTTTKTGTDTTTNTGTDTKVTRVTTPTDITTAPDTTLPPGIGGNTGPAIIGGGTTVNPNGTITTSPRIPGIPVGGFTGMTSLRDAYTKGGGSLGYIPETPKTIEEFNAKYNTMTGGSKQAYDYLMGNAAYSPVPYTPTGEIMKPYWESVGRAPVNLSTKKYIFKDGKYELNPAYVKPSYVLAGEKAAMMTNQDKEPTESPGAGNKWSWNTTDKKWEAVPIASTSTTETTVNEGGPGGEAAGGLMAMAAGGMSQQFDLGGYSDGGRLLRGPGDGVSDSIPATIGNKRPARLADGEFVVPARIVSELGNGSTEAGARKLYAMMDRVQAARRSSIGKGKVAKNSRADKYLPA